MQKGPYFGNVAYISPNPEGYLAASANVGRTLQGAFETAGANIGAAIQKYQQNKVARQQNAMEFETLAPFVAGIVDSVEVAKQNPADPRARLANYATDPTIAQLVKKMGDFDAMSTSQQRKFLDLASNTVTRIERDELQNYTRGLERENMSLKGRQVAVDERNAATAEAKAESDIDLDKRRVELLENSALREQSGPQEFVASDGSLFVYRGGTLLPSTSRSKAKLDDGDVLTYRTKDGSERKAIMIKGEPRDVETLLSLESSTTNFMGDRMSGVPNPAIPGNVDAGVAPAAPAAPAAPTAPVAATSPDRTYANNGQPLTPDEAAKLPSGTWFVGSDGVARQRK